MASLCGSRRDAMAEVKVRSLRLLGSISQSLHSSKDEQTINKSINIYNILGVMEENETE